MNHNNGPIGRLKLGQHINIVGGGISGLAMGFFFKKNNIPFSILEASDSLGGKIKTKKFTSGIAEQAANAIYADQLMLDIIEELNLDFQFSTPKLKRKISALSKCFCCTLCHYRRLCFSYINNSTRLYYFWCAFNCIFNITNAYRI